MNHLTTTGRSGRSSQTYILLTAFMALLVIVGIAYYGVPFFYDFMEGEFGWTRTQITSGNAIGKLLVGPLFGFIAGWLIDKYGPRSLMMTGIVFAAIALVGLSFTTSLPMFYTFFVFNALGYVLAGPLPCQVLISRWFDRNRGKAMGIAYLGIGTGGALAPLISSGLESHFNDWHMALAVLGVLVLLLAFPFAFFIKDPKAPPAASKDKQATTVPVRDILRNRNFYLLGIGSMCSIGAVAGVNQHLKLYLRDLDFGQSEAAQVMSLVLLSSLIGRVLMGFLADLVNRKHVMMLIYSIVAAAIPLLLVPDFPGRIYIFAVIFGIGLGGDYMIIPLIAGDLFGVRALGRTMGIILVADGISEALFPMFVGMLHEGASHSYTVGFITLIGVALLGLLTVSFLPKTGNRQTT